LLEGKKVNLRIMEKEDLPLFTEWINNPEVWGEYNPLWQMSRTEVEKMFESPHELKSFLIESKDGNKIGFIIHYYVLDPAGKQLEISYSLIPNERKKGYCTEAVKIMVDYLFLSKETFRIQAQTDARNVASQKILAKVNFKKEGILRKSLFIGGEWRDSFLYSILREEWKEPKILTKSA
jgi:RimJ/RimL family protein N-acetyltransferase